MNQEPLEQLPGEQRINLENTSLEGEGQIGQSQRDLAQQHQTNQNSIAHKSSVNIIQNDSNNKALTAILTIHLLFIYPLIVSLILGLVGLGIIYLYSKPSAEEASKAKKEITVQDDELDSRKNLIAREIVQNFEILNSRIDLLQKQLNQSSKNQENSKFLNQSQINLPGFCHDYHNISIYSLDIETKKGLDEFYQTLDMIQEHSDKLIYDFNKDTLNNNIIEQRINTIRELSRTALDLGIGVINRSGVSLKDLERELELEDEYDQLGSSRMICSSEAKVSAIRRLEAIILLYESDETSIESEREDLEMLRMRIMDNSNLNQ